MEENSHKRFVIDASFALAYLLPDETTTFVTRIFQQYKNGKVDFVSSLLLPFEVLNGLRSAVIKKRLNSKIASTLAEAFLNLEIELKEIDLKQIFFLSLEKNISVYDASYLTLSLSKKVPLLTLDKQLQSLIEKSGFYSKIGEFD